MKPGATVLVFPAWVSNPYLNLLSLGARAAGYRFVGTTALPDLLREAQRIGEGDVIHIHWTSPIAQSARTAGGARRAVRRLRRSLRAARARGGRLVWTVHNRLPHELAHRDQEIELYRTLAHEADVIHVMTPDTPDVLDDVCRLPPEKVRVIRHPSYEGVYDDGTAREDARRSFGIEPHERAVLFLGQIRPYKGIDTLLEAIDTATPSADHPLVLLLAGHAPDGADDIVRALPAHVRSIVHLEYVADGDMARWFKAADVAVFPYRRILNSGSVHLAATFGVPVILPDEPHLRAYFGRFPWVGFFSPTAPTSSLSELLGDPRMFADVSPADFADFTDEISPWSIAREYRAILDEVSPRASPAGAAGSRR